MNGRSTVPGLLRQRAADTPDAVALCHPDGSTLTFGQWDRSTDALAAALAADGLRVGQRVALLFDEREWFGFATAFCGVLRAGGVAVPLSARLPPGQLVDRVTVAGAVGTIREGCAVPPELGGWQRGPADADANADAVPDRATPAGPAQIIFTSGTEGSARPVVATHGNLTHGHDATPGRRQLAHSRHFLHAFPLGTNAAQTMLLTGLTAEPAALVMPRFDAAEVCAAVEEFQVGTLFLVPAMARELLDSGELHSRDLSSVVLVGTTGDVLPGSVARALAEALPYATIVNTYSSTEAAPARTTMVFDSRRPEAVGRGPVRITDDAGREVPTGEVGHVWIGSAAPPRRYLDGGDTGTFRDGWTRTGDRGRLDDEGYLHLAGRDSSTIHTGGTTVSPFTVEQALREHPDVRDCAVTALADPVLGERPAAVLVTRTGAVPADLRTFLAGRLSGAEIPQRVVCVAALPRNDGGKVVVRALRDLFPPVGSTATAAPVTVVERHLADIWATVLGVAAVGRDDDFLALGGNSMSALRLARLVADQFAVPTPVSALYARPGLAEQAAWIADRIADSP
ncbi:AMP-binding protein [Micromonospora humidisoli]|uniref:AMP-binding protein n=1 Tax=Micromonospora sp. AKA109 TaxID=2733865 RepID=UPI002492239E|nr:AMP-binding protein [Micromonospora sp. AKA109]